MSALLYENFICSAFSFALNKQVGRGNDPAHLADTDIFNFGSLERVKTGAAYAIGIYNAHIRNLEEMEDSDYDLMDKFLSDVINANDSEQVAQLIDKYRSTFFKKYNLK
ncbi:hypothetical protein RQP50_27590 [Paenibacillus sp. chi10]|uniref:Uncharacterized protein n=1 Tax=Paenibacillus suaedae TaxID=3077233 RepID=A0AAJ2K048_9BACL|nr:hypothetical protein [Paenibacillus sp. chi10]MDT8979998.1 hypothetical protein [Paenibacillus sp. chi10]